MYHYRHIIYEQDEEIHMAAIEAYILYILYSFNEGRQSN